MTNIVFFCWHYPAAVGFTMYKFIPLPYRVLYINSASFFWNGYLCLRFEDYSDTKVETENNSIAKTTNDTCTMSIATAVPKMVALPALLSPEKTKQMVERTRKAMDEHYDTWKRNRQSWDCVHVCKTQWCWWVGVLFPTYRTCTRVTIKIKTPDTCTITETQTLESQNKHCVQHQICSCTLPPSTPFDFACTTVRYENLYYYYDLISNN